MLTCIYAHTNLFRLLNHYGLSHSIAIVYFTTACFTPVHCCVLSNISVNQMDWFYCEADDSMHILDCVLYEAFTNPVK